MQFGAEINADDGGKLIKFMGIRLSISVKAFATRY